MVEMRVRTKARARVRLLEKVMADARPEQRAAAAVKLVMVVERAITRVAKRAKLEIVL